MIHRSINRLFAVSLFIVAEILYFSTMAPTLSFWDCGETITTSCTLGIPHPPGAPLFLLFGRLFTMLPFFSDIGARVNLISTLVSSSTVMLTYLITVRLIVLYRASDPDSWTPAEKVAAYGGAAVGALCLALSDSFWFNAVEASLWSSSLFFIAIITWLILRWHEEDPKPGHERWLMLVMYMIGLSIGVHLLSLLAVFAVSLVYYFKKYKVTPLSFVLLVFGSSVLFFLIYTVIIKGLPVLVHHTSWWGFLFLCLLLGYGVWYTHRKRLVIVNTALVSIFLIIIGYTSYALIYVRAHAGPPINENNPSTPEAFFSYLNREQYGDMPLLPRRWSPEPVHQYYYQQYSSDLDYFLRYQVQKMYLRYFGWQFIGREHDMEGAGIDWSVLWGLPFLAGFAGAVMHFRRQWKMGLVVCALFVMTGAALVIYLNQTEPQPRERDYSYVASFFAFALWIGIGIESIWTLAAEKLKAARRQDLLFPAAVLVVAAALVFLNGRMLQANYRVHSRAGNYVPWDWAWNMLQSCEKDAILFTNGDNDTFPLWYLQEVERIRTDVRIVNLSLANTGWYLAQLKNTSPRGAKRIAFSMNDEEVAGITYEPVDSVTAVLPSARARAELLRRSKENGVRLPGEPLESIVWMLKPGLIYDSQGYFRPQDKAVYDIVMSNFADRPLYFALTVDPENMIGLESFLRLDGLVYKLVPLKSPDPMSYVDSSLLYGNLAGIYRYRNLDKPGFYLEETSRRLCGNYSPLFVRLALELAEEPSSSIRVKGSSTQAVTVRQGELAMKVLDLSTKLFPLSQYPVNPELAGSVIALYVRLGEKQRAASYIGYLEKLCQSSSPLSEPKLYYVLARAYRNVGRNDDARRIIGRLAKELDQPGLIKDFETKKD
ncbi:MAG: DUF2723 domain-containing protein [Chlorobiaceae bacterium]|nr:DUF2723 domain-containing protein [Chlorobiaceae bacterium]